MSVTEHATLCSLIVGCCCKVAGGVCCLIPHLYCTLYLWKYAVLLGTVKVAHEGGENCFLCLGGHSVEHGWQVTDGTLEERLFQDVLQVHTCFGCQIALVVKGTLHLRVVDGSLLVQPHHGLVAILCYQGTDACVLVLT